MKMADVMRELGEMFEIPEDVIQKAFDFANAVAGQGEEAKKQIERELTDEEVKAWRAYGVLLITTAVIDPEFRKKFIEQTIEEGIKKN